MIHCLVDVSLHVEERNFTKGFGFFFFSIQNHGYIGIHMNEVTIHRFDSYQGDFEHGQCFAPCFLDYLNTAKKCVRFNQSI